MRILTPLVVLLSTLHAIMTHKLQNNHDENNMSYVKDLLAFFSNYSFIFHTNSNGINVANTLAEYVNKNLMKFTIVYNKDAWDYNPTRPHGTRFVHVALFRDPWDYFVYMSDRRNVILYDLVIFVLYDGSSHLAKQYEFEFWAMANLELAGNVLVVDLQNTTRLYNVCYYCGISSKTLNLIEEIHGSITAQPAEIFPRTLKNFQGHFFLIAYLSYFPYTFCRVRRPGEILDPCSDLRGSEAVALKEISKILNFTYRFVNYGDDKSTEYVFNKVLERAVDFAIGGITRSANRSPLVTYTNTFARENYQLMYVYKFPSSSHLFTFFLPFNSNVWILIIFVMVILSSFVQILINFRTGLGTCRIDYANSLNICIKSIVEQSIKIPLKYSNRKCLYVFLAFWWFSCLDITTMYKSKLASIIVKPPHCEPKTLNDLLNGGYDIVLETQSTEPLQDIGIFNTNTLNSCHVVHKTGICNAISHTLTNKAALMGEYSFLQYQSQHNCPDLFQQKPSVKYDRNLLRITIKSFVTMQNGWPLQKGVTYWKSFSNIFGYIENGGLFVKWHRDAVAEGGKIYHVPFSKDNTDFSEPEKLSLMSYLSAFVILLCGNATAVVCFVLEVVLKQYRKRNFV